MAAREAKTVAHAMTGWCIDKDHAHCMSPMESIYTLHCTCDCHKGCQCEEKS